MSGNNNLTRIEVKAKQGVYWPNCKGIFGEGVFLVLVDYANCDETERPDFYVLTSEDWLDVIKKEVQKYSEKHPERRIEINSENVPVFLDEVNKYGKPYEGMGIKAEIIQDHKEAWFKISKEVKNFWETGVKKAKLKIAASRNSMRMFCF